MCPLEFLQTNPTVMKTAIHELFVKELLFDRHIDLPFSSHKPQRLPPEAITNV